MKGFFLHRVVTGDEKWIHYDNLKKKKSWGPPGHASTSTAKPNIHGKKLMLCIWWDQLGVVYYELLKPNETITGALYRTQLMRLSRALKEKRATTPDTTKLFFCMIMLVHMLRHRSKPTWKHSMGSFTPLALFTRHCSFWLLPVSMTHGLSEQHFTSYEDTKNWVDSWIASKEWSVFPYAARKMGKTSG